MTEEKSVAQKPHSEEKSVGVTQKPHSVVATQKPHSEEKSTRLEGSSAAMNEFETIKAAYNENRQNKSFNLLLLGESGSGKTFLARTARGPVHIDSFDPGGSKCLREWIKRGHIVVDSRYEDEDPLKPFAFNLWEKEIERRIKLNYFDFLGTYILDSSTTWGIAIMNEILKRAGIPGTQPRYTKDYGPQKATIHNWLKRILSFKCDVILTGHLQQLKDEATERVTYRYMTTGQGTVIIPLLFDELWIMDPKETATGISYRVLTTSTGTHIARSRLAAGGKLERYEEPDLKKILKKVGFSPEDRKL
ncbi:MAG: hypothetical protein DDT31_01670 [Syntrophomonadaceae bacterium]|nr:hypothetical protein [Bacillota bacterium]